MNTNLYDILGISRNATQEDVRRAYRRKALETHPDRLPQGVSAAEKAISEELFRKVNNAYEVLSDQQNRIQYDQYGVWPPPTTSQPTYPFANGPHDPFSDSSFFRDPFSQHPFFRASRTDPMFGGFGSGPRTRPGGFTDPFVLFNSIFGDLHRAFESDPFFNTPDPFGRRGFGSGQASGGNGFFSRGFPSAFPTPSSPFDDPAHGGVGGSRMQAFGNSSNGGNGGRWVSQSWTTSMVNGAAHTKSVCKDSEGNEHVLYRYPDGTERRTVNGVEQSNNTRPQRTQLAIAPAPTSAPAPVSYPTQGSNYMYNYSAPPPYASGVAQQPVRSRSSRHVHYDDSGDRHRDRHKHDHPSREGDWDKDGEYRHGYRDGGHKHDPAQNSSTRSYWGS